MLKRPKARFYGINKKIRTAHTGEISSKSFKIGRGQQGAVDSLTILKGNHSVTLAEKTYFTRTQRPMYLTSASQDFKRLKRLQEFLPKKLFLPTIRLKVEKGKKPTLVMTLLGLKRKDTHAIPVIEWNSIWERHQLDPSQIHKLTPEVKAVLNEIFKKVENWDELQHELIAARSIAQKNNCWLPLESFFVEVNSKTKKGRLYIVDVGLVQFFSKQRVPKEWYE